MSDANADTPEAFAERERRKRVIDLARAIFARMPVVEDTERAVLGAFTEAETFDAVAEKYRKDGTL